MASQKSFETLPPELFYHAPPSLTYQWPGFDPVHPPPPAVSSSEAHAGVQLKPASARNLGLEPREGQEGQEGQEPRGNHGLESDLVVGQGVSASCEGVLADIVGPGK